ncbi:MAG: hypothetical protein AAFW73_15500 [Bacteroidota bacterium]
MLETLLRPGQSANDLPKHEAGGVGSGSLCQIGVNGQLYHGAQYLPFAPNGINWIAQNGLDVLSYNFTGCIMAVFDHEGTRKVAHISTGPSQDCKIAWDELKKSCSNVLEFRPSDFVDNQGKTFVGCYGLITSDLQTYAITTVQDRGQYVISSIKMAHLLR